MNNFSLQLLKNAYEHYQETGDYEYTILPVNPSYLVSVLNCIGTLLEDSYIEDVTDNLLNDNAINIVPMEKMSFCITRNGIEYVRSQGNL